ncbi:MAG: hypothetical protein M1383_03125 [Patescibacteria group bacterium]|nr:hypothetical protein [Patescibacteria group bacterium]
MTNNIVALAISALLAASAAMGQFSTATTNLAGCPVPPDGYVINCTTMQLYPKVTVAAIPVPAAASAVKPVEAFKAAVNDGMEMEKMMAELREPAGVSWSAYGFTLIIALFLIAGAAVWSWRVSQQHPTVHVAIQPAQGTATVNMVPQVVAAGAGVGAAAGAGAPAMAAAAAAGAGPGGGGGMAAAAAGPWVCVCGRNNPAATAFCGACGRPHP